VVALLGSSRREGGGWNVSPGTDIIAVAGRARIDLTDTDVRGERLKISVISVLGLVTIAVPPEMAVADSGVTLLGSRSVRGGVAEPGESGEPGAPGLVLSGACILGAMRVRRKQ
jgi:Cell wall-active antibiotics response 4TMS YvqF